MKPEEFKASVELTTKRGLSVGGSMAQEDAITEVDVVTVLLTELWEAAIQTRTERFQNWQTAGEIKQAEILKKLEAL